MVNCIFLIKCIYIALYVSCMFKCVMIHHINSCKNTISLILSSYYFQNPKTCLIAVLLELTLYFNLWFIYTLCLIFSLVEQIPPI